MNKFLKPNLEISMLKAIDIICTSNPTQENPSFGGDGTVEASEEPVIL